MRFVSPLRLAAPAALVVACLAMVTPATAQAQICGHPGQSKIDHVVVIAFENHSYQSILGSSAPRSYFKTLAGSCSSALRYHAAHVPRSLPNYIAVTSGKVSIPGDCVPGPGCQSGTKSIFGLIGPRNWRLWAESMPHPCYGPNQGEYVSRHAPAIYYTRIPRSVCRADMLPLPSRTPAPQRKFTWVTPNLIHDMHDGTPAQASAWLQRFLSGPRGLLRTPSYQTGHTAIFIWFDTGNGSSGLNTPLPLIVVSRHAPRRRFTRGITDYALLRTWESIFGLPCLNSACDARSLRGILHM